jgi:hypothetical protein
MDHLPPLNLRIKSRLHSFKSQNVLLQSLTLAAQSSIQVSYSAKQVSDTKAGSGQKELIEKEKKKR